MPVELWQAGADGVLPEPWNVQAIREDLPMAPQYHLVPAATHADFGAPCDPAITAAICHDTSHFDRAQFHDTFDADVVAFFKANLASIPDRALPRR